MSECSLKKRRAEKRADLSYFPLKGDGEGKVLQALDLKKRGFSSLFFPQLSRLSQAWGRPFLFMLPLFIESLTQGAFAGDRFALDGESALSTPAQAEGRQPGLPQASSKSPSSPSSLLPLSAFLEAAKTHSFGIRGAKAVYEQKEKEVDGAHVKLLPVLGAQASYTRNQYEALVQGKVLTPEDQLDMYLTANWVLVDVGQWERIGYAKRSRDASKSRLAQSALEAEREVTQKYYQLIASEAVKTSAYRSLETSNDNLAYVSARKNAGFVHELDEKRAVAEVARNKQVLADADYQVRVARRALETASGLKPGEGGALLEDDLKHESPLSSWENRNEELLPQIKAAVDDAKAASRLAQSTRAALLPTLSFNAQQRFTNATGFQDRSSVYTLSAVALWRFDFTNLVNAQAQANAAKALEVEEERVRAEAKDAIYEAWQKVESQIEKAHATLLGLEASEMAVALAKQKYKAGTATFLDVVTAERDAFSAEVERVQAFADLLFARANLRLFSGESAMEKRTEKMEEEGLRGQK